MALTKLERPINTPIHIDRVIVNSFCTEEFHLTYEDRKFFGITRKVTKAPQGPEDRKENV
jgi:hypothetical protein